MRVLVRQVYNNQALKRINVPALQSVGNPSYMYSCNSQYFSIHGNAELTTINAPSFRSVGRGYSNSCQQHYVSIYNNARRVLLHSCTAAVAPQASPRVVSSRAPGAQHVV